MFMHNELLSRIEETERFARGGNEERREMGSAGGCDGVGCKEYGVCLGRWGFEGGDLEKEKNVGEWGEFRGRIVAIINFSDDSVNRDRLGGCSGKDEDMTR
jgi:hypothetical protein